MDKTYKQAITNLENSIDSAMGKHAREILHIFISGRIPVLVIDPAPDTLEALRVMGWDGTAELFEMRPRAVRKMARSCAEVDDPVTVRWLERRTAKAFVVTGHGSLLLNIVAVGGSLGWLHEPGSNGRALA